LPLFENSITTYLFYLFCLTGFVHVLYILTIFIRFAFYRRKEKAVLNTPVSVIICCRNEEENLLNNLQTIAEQDYPNFEIIIVNHMSTDGTADVVRAFQMHYPNIRTINVQRSNHLRQGKKFPLSIGIKAAKNPILVLTDADCKPTSLHWLTNITRNYHNNTEIVLGYGPMTKTKGLLNWFLRFETTYIAVQYFSYALAKIPYMSVGRNFSYTKEIFDKNKGFKAHYSILSGDDDLFLQQAATRKNVSIEIDESTWCYSDAKETWSDWSIQKKRHYTTTPKYTFIKKLLLGIYTLSWFFTLLLFVILLLDIEYSGISIVIFSSILTLKWIVFARCFNQLHAIKMAILFPFVELVYMMITPFIYFGQTKKQKWK
jgi:glycosyltransferase involved in cell wall biosynthesis